MNKIKEIVFTILFILYCLIMFCIGLALSIASIILPFTEKGNWYDIFMLPIGLIIIVGLAILLAIPSGMRDFDFRQQ